MNLHEVLSLLIYHAIDQPTSDSNDSDDEVIPLEGSFFSRNLRRLHSIKVIRMMVARAKINRYVPPMSMKQYHCLKKLYRGGEFYTFDKRTFFRDEVDVNILVKALYKECLVVDRKLFMKKAVQYMGKTMADRLFGRVTGSQMKDSDMLDYLTQTQNRLYEKCHYRDTLYKVVGMVTRNGKCKKELVSITYVSSVAVKLFKKNTHILFVDACHTSDHGVVMLAVFLDGNHMVQPVGFQICSSENHCNWDRFFETMVNADLIVNDLVVISDRHQSIVNAVSKHYPSAEHAHCFVHVERNIQDKWVKCYGSLSYDNTDVVELFNSIMENLHRARFSVSERECNSYLQNIKMIERVFNTEGETPVYDYIKSIEGILMYKWKHNHLMQFTSNAVEICMKDIMERRYGMNSCRAETVLNKYRYLVRWIYERVEKREEALKIGSRVPVSSASRIPTPYIEKYVRSLAHYYETYRGEFIVKDASSCNRNIHEARIMVYKVIDQGYGSTNTVDLRNQSCDCHVPHWSKLPCIHVIAVLHETNRYSQVWEKIGKEYLVSEVAETCKTLTKQEKEEMEALVDNNMIGFKIDNPSNQDMRNCRGRTVRNPQRHESRGESNND